MRIDDLLAGVVSVDADGDEQRTVTTDVLEWDQLIVLLPVAMSRSSCMKKYPAGVFSEVRRDQDTLIVAMSA